jgi:hypothetical protein
MQSRLRNNYSKQSKGMGDFESGVVHHLSTSYYTVLMAQQKFSQQSISDTTCQN